MNKRTDDDSGFKMTAGDKGPVPSAADEQIRVAVRCLEATQVRPHDQALVASVVKLMLISG